MKTRLSTPKIQISSEEATFLVNLIHSVQVRGDSVHAVGTLIGKLYKVANMRSKIESAESIELT